jgi:hypothetical protein
MGDGHAPASQPVSHFPKQAIVVVHGMGEQMPMDTIKSFVRAAWETDTELTANGLPNPAEVWSKPDVRTGSLELRRITTRQSVVTSTFPQRVRSDFYELYWADLSGGSTWGDVRRWIFGLLWRNPFTQVPRSVFLAWIVLWLIALGVISLAIATAAPDQATFGPFSLGGWTIGPINLWDCPVLNWLHAFDRWILGLATLALTSVATSFIVPYFGRVVRYTSARPENIAARKSIRERGLDLLSELHAKDYDRIILVGHSLGSILAYDLISYFWARRPNVRNVEEASQAEFDGLRKLEQAIAVLESQAEPSAQAITAYLTAQTDFGRLLRLRAKPSKPDEDSRWLITDFVTLGSPLSHAEFLMAKDEPDLLARQEDREYPTSPPLRELLDPNYVADARKAGLPLEDPPRLLAFPFAPGIWQLHHATPFAAMRWTNIYDPAFLVAFGDLISGPVAPVFGHGIIDVNLRKLRRCQSWHFTHTDYWKLPRDPSKRRERIVQLRKALDLGGQDRRL